MTASLHVWHVVVRTIDMPSDGVGDHEASEVESGVSRAGFDHGAGHPLLYLDDAKAPNCRKNNEFKDLGNYSEWPKVAGAVIKAGCEHL